MKYKRIPLTQGYSAIVDARDHYWLSRYKWRVSKHSNSIYVVRLITIPGGRRVKISMHREILGLSFGSIVDHINGNGLDNRKGNLRRATNSQNMANLLKENPTSGFRGVREQNGKWMARITLNSCPIYLGTFKTPKAAHLAYKKAHIKLHGAFSIYSRPTK